MCLCKEQGKIEPATVADHFPPCGADYNAFVLGELRSYVLPAMTRCRLRSPGL